MDGVLEIVTSYDVPMAPLIARATILIRREDDDPRGAAKTLASSGMNASTNMPATTNSVPMRKLRLLMRSTYSRLMMMPVDAHAALSSAWT